MPGLTKANKKSKPYNLCTYRTSVPSGDHTTPFECPSDLAIRCISDILTEISELDTPEKQIEKFHKIIEKYLNKLCLENKSQKKIQCFWSLYEKSKITDEDIPSGSKAKDIINLAIGRANEEYHSGNLLEKLVHLEIGTGHVFDVIPHKNKITFKAYSRLGMELPVIPEYFEYLLSNPDIQAFDLFIEKLVEIVEKSSANIEDLIVLVNQEIIGYCESWKIAGSMFDAALKKSEKYQEEKSITEKIIAETCAHFALMALYSENNAFSHASYILAPTFRGQPHSSMVIYWPFFNEGYSVYPHINFLLHLVLGLNSIQAKSVEKELKREKDIKEILKHDIKNLYLNIHALYQDTLDDWTEEKIKADQQTKDRFCSMYSYVSLATYGIGLEVASYLNKETSQVPITISSLYEKLCISTRFHDIEVIFKDNEKWASCERKVDKKVLVPIANLITNVIKHSVGNEQIELTFDNKISECALTIKSLTAFEDNKAKESLQEPLSKRMPITSRGFWICRRILEQIGGKLSLNDPEKQYRTIFAINVPWIV